MSDLDDVSVLAKVGLGLIVVALLPLLGLLIYGGIYALITVWSDGDVVRAIAVTCVEVLMVGLILFAVAMATDKMP